MQLAIYFRRGLPDKYLYISRLFQKAFFLFPDFFQTGMLTDVFQTFQTFPDFFQIPDIFGRRALSAVTQPAKLLKSNTGRGSFCLIGIQYVMPYSQKYTPPHCFFLKFCRLGKGLMDTASKSFF